MAPRPATPRLTFAGYEESRDVPNIVVDGSPNDSTVLAISHWPGVDQAPGTARDLSAQMVFDYLENPTPHQPASVVTNNHYDQDGLAGVFALVDPETAVANEELLVDLACAGDFATFTHRSAARASMALASYADPQRSPIGAELAGRPYPEQCRILYEHTLPEVIPMLRRPEDYSHLWEDEDANLTATEKALAGGRIRISENVPLDLAVVSIDSSLPDMPGHRFGSGSLDEIHPMALHNATDRFRLLLVRDGHYRYVDRYETWVQYCSRRPLPRTDLAPLAERLNELDSPGAGWTAEPPSAINPTMAPEGTSSLDPATVEAEVVRHLTDSPPAWDPYRT